MNNLTAEKLKELLNYDPETGLFIRVVFICNRARKGDIAGSIDKRAGYRCIVINGKRYQAHRLAWLYVHGRWPESQLDHINRNAGDNRITNLREVSNQENHHNLKLHVRNTSGHSGVYWNKKNKKWVAYITVNYQTIMNYLPDPQ